MKIFKKNGLVFLKCAHELPHTQKRTGIAVLSFKNKQELKKYIQRKDITVLCAFGKICVRFSAIKKMGITGYTYNKLLKLKEEFLGYYIREMTLNKKFVDQTAEALIALKLGKSTTGFSRNARIMAKQIKTWAIQDSVPSKTTCWYCGHTRVMCHNNKWKR